MLSVAPSLLRALCALLLAAVLWPAAAPSAAPAARAFVGPAVVWEGQGGDDEIVEEFKRYYKKYKDTPTRVEAILALSGTESAGAVAALLPILRDPEPEVVRAAVRVLAGFKTRPPVDALLAALAENQDPLLRTGILRALADGKYKGTSEACLPLLKDQSWDVRRRTVQALANGGDPAAAEAIAPLVADREVAVRCAAFDALAQMRSTLVIEPAIAALGDETWQVRGSAVHALRDVRSKQAIGPLIERMAVEEGRLVADIGEALGSITGRGFEQDLAAWRNFWSTYSERFEIPTDEELAKLRAKQKERRETYHPPGAVSYHGIDSPSRSILFVIDVSGSMEQEVVERDRFKDGGYPSFRRIDIVKTELIRTIEGLESYVDFNIVAFATDTKRWKKSQVKANVLNKSSAISFVQRLEAIGGASKEDLAAAGLTGSANLDAGRTNTYAALMDALEAGEGAKDEQYRVALDTIFFLSDGRPSWGKYTDPEDILREVRAANELRKVVVHTIALGEFQKHFMERLAAENGGTYVDLGM